jgi:hypothetical protein
MRALLPSWRFFDTIAAPLALWVRVDGVWREVALVPARPSYGLLFNPQGNLGLLAYSTLERLLAELDDTPPEQLVSYALVRSWVEAELPAGTRFEFEVRDAHTGEALLRSLPHAKEPR